MARYEFAHSHGGPLDQYYASPGWAKRREVYFARYGRRCEACGSTDRIDVHHADYGNLCEEADEDLVALCRSCHSECHHLQTEFRWRLQDMTRKFLDYRKDQAERTNLRMINDELRRKQDTLLRRSIDTDAVPALELHVQDPVVVRRREQPPLRTRPEPRGAPDVCVVCDSGGPALDNCVLCQSALHRRCSRQRRTAVCSPECSVEWMEATGH